MSSSTAPQATPPEPLMMRILVRPAAYRHRKVWGRGCVAAGLWLVVLGVILCSFAFWWGAALIAVGVLELWVAYRLLVAPLPQRCPGNWNGRGRAWWTTLRRGCARSSVTCTMGRRRRWSLSP